MYLNIVGDRQQGKTTALVDIAISTIVAAPARRVLFLTDPVGGPHTMKLIKKSLEGAGIKFKAWYDRVLLNNGSEIIVAPIKGPGRGYTLDCAIIDNIDQVDTKNQMLIKMTLPAMTKMIITSSQKPYKL